SFITTLLDTPTATALNVGTTNATQINLNKNVVVKGNTSDSSSTALTVTNSSDTALLTIRNDGLASFSGNVSVSGTYNSNTFTSSQLTFGAASATTVQSANNQNLTVRSQGSGTLTLGNGSSQFTLQGNQSSIITASNGSYTATVSFTNPVANVTYRFPALAEGTYDICTLGGNCLGNGDIIQGGNAYNATIVVGATYNFGLNLITNNTTRLSVTNTGNIAMDTDTLYVDAINHRVGIGNTSPSSLFSVGSSNQLRVDGSGNILTSGTYNTNTFTSSSLIFGANSDSTIQAASNQGLTVRSQGSGTLTLGATAQQTTLQGSASSSIVIGNGTYTTTIDFTNPTANVVYRFPALGAGTYDICTSGNNCTGLGAYIQNQFSAQQAGSNFWISGTGRADTSFLSPLFLGSNAANGTITIQGTSASSGNTATSPNIQFKVGNSGATTAMTILNNGNVGIGTLNPLERLHVQGSLTVTNLGTSYTASKSGNTITATAGTFTLADVGRYFVWANGAVDIIGNYISSTQVNVYDS
ncbi:MAG TPA: hypothetical protein PLJ97_02950, partial [Candidatus Saccharibacteria bacterium]|nr:hypothetical protein [Candidatus Saccharibacteria bacterium]